MSAGAACARILNQVRHLLRGTVGRKRAKAHPAKGYREGLQGRLGLKRAKVHPASAQIVSYLIHRAVLLVCVVRECG